jgi:hypothetical protein
MLAVPLPLLTECLVRLPVRLGLLRRHFNFNQTFSHFVSLTFSPTAHHRPDRALTPRLAQDGDVVEVEIDGIGCISNPVVDEKIE